MKKVLRAIGGFFAKIGRWIANTAWIQPLLIVGGIFAIIFSIPYIKRGIEGLINANQVDSQLAFYKSHALSLSGAEDEDGNSQVDKLFTYLENDDKESIKKDFGEKFFFSFAKEDCQNCKDCAEGYRTFESKFYSEYHLDKDPDTQDQLSPYKFYSVMADDIVTNTESKFDGKYRISLVLDKHEQLLEEIVGEYVEESSSSDGYRYWLLNNLKNGQQSLVDSITDLANINVDKVIDVPMTFLIDVSDNVPDEAVNVNGITAIYFNFTSLMEDDSDNVINQAKFLRDCWTYSNAFSKTGDEINYSFESEK